MEKNKIICGDCVSIMKSFPDNVIDLTVTSPPYDCLRDYNGFVFNYKDIAIELFRVTKQGGIVVWVVGDQTIKGSETGTSFEQALYFKSVGFNIHDTMIYQKHNFSNPSSNRYHQIFEYMFIFSKGKPKIFNPIKDRENKYITCWGRNTSRQKDGTLIERKKNINPKFGMRNNIWKYNCGFGFAHKDKEAYEHPATFPEQLAVDHILSWSNEEDVILDPMCGSGTVCIVAKKLNRNFIGIDISKDYCELAERRVSKV